MRTARSFARLLGIAAVGMALVVPPARADGALETYLVVYKAKAVPADAPAAVARAGGSLVSAFSEIGVVVARSDRDSFRSALLLDPRIDGVSATSRFGVAVVNDADDGPPPGDYPNSPAADADTFSTLQWDMRQILAPEAHAVTGGSPAVVVGDIDTGVDKDHPDLQANLDFGKSASCQSGAPDPNPAAWDDAHGHGTHTAGTIAAGANGFGIVGVAPNVKIAAIKASTDEGFFFPEMVVCAFYWAGTQRLNVTNNSYFADPFLFNCRNEAEQRAIWKAERRAIEFAMQRGVTVVASAGNESTDLSHPHVDTISPDFPPGSEMEREITNACVVIPVEIPGVVGVSADGHNMQTPEGYLKSFYSSFGVSGVDVVAPGGDSIFGQSPESPNGRVLSTYPAEAPCNPARRLVDPGVPTAVYCYLQGTSMAAPHVAGVAALVVSRYGTTAGKQGLNPGQVEAWLQRTADPQPCPDAVPAGYEAFTQSDGSAQVCQGGWSFNSWYGHGQVNALSAVTSSS